MTNGLDHLETSDDRPHLEILVVEDNELDAERLMRHMRRDSKINWDITWATSLAVALSLTTSRRFDAVLLDLTLPDANGFDGLSAMVTANPDCPVVIQSGMDDDGVAAEAVAHGAQDYLFKSNITASALGRSVNHAITRHSLRATKDALMATNIELDDFAHVVAHDLRAPVRTARLLANRLIASTEDAKTNAPAGLDFGDRLDQVLERLDSMVLGMLEYSGIRALDIELEPMSLDHAVCDALADVQADGESVGLTYTVDVDPSISVKANHNMLQRVLVNLIANSIKFTRPGVPLTIDVSAEVNGGVVVLKVADNGIGIPEGYHERVFELTERLDHGAAGLGFGLAICRRCMTKMAGTINFDPEIETGATAVLTLPTVYVADAEPTNAISPGTIAIGGGWE